jgi:hypothetical protein
MIIERYNLACSMIFKAISKTGSLGSCILVGMDICSSKRLAMKDLQIPNAAETRIIPERLFPPRFSDKNRFTTSCPDAVLVAPISAKTKKCNRLAMKGGGFLGVAGCNRGKPGAT